jgi:hypothetical protein
VDGQSAAVALHHIIRALENVGMTCTLFCAQVRLPRIQGWMSFATASERSIPSPLVNHLSENGTGRPNRVDSLLNTNIRCFVGERRLNETENLDK